jgi:hypothetical protein
MFSKNLPDGQTINTSVRLLSAPPQGREMNGLLGKEMRVTNRKSRRVAAVVDVFVGDGEVEEHGGARVFFVTYLPLGQSKPTA